MCGSRKYPYPTPHGRFFGLKPPPSWNFQFCSILSFKFLLLRHPPPSEFPMTFLGTGVNIFWNCKIWYMHAYCINPRVNWQLAWVPVNRHLSLNFPYTRDIWDSTRYIGVDFTFRLPDCVRYIGYFIKSEFVKSGFFSIHFIVILAGLNKFVH